ncbi:hypothetical protein F7725_018164 [Dissostichus mawsoni]|uniref:BHLH domain-containing protein n=1 Tax=Dissostichus mawsoni TaxID=36200 RepID=A0A7J5XSB4_DISMA|nr:hypothetical protein F7725_018164 [Dissostichus mawsoni]
MWFAAKKTRRRGCPDSGRRNRRRAHSLLYQRSAAAAFGDHNIQYQFRTEGGQVTYRVVQVTDQHLDGRDDGGGAVSVVSTAAFAGAPQAVAQEARQERRGRGDALRLLPRNCGERRDVSVQAAADPTLTHRRGFYVMMTPPDVIQTGTQRTIAPRTQSYPADENELLQQEGLNWKMDGPRTPRDERRRAQHNEVERRRRDKINNWIVTLSKIIPDCNMDSAKTGASSLSSQSKGGILSKACDYIRDLRQSNQRLQESVKEVDRIQVDNDLCRQQIEELKNENALLRAQLQQHGIEMVGETPPQ